MYLYAHRTLENIRIYQIKERSISDGCCHGLTELILRLFAGIFDCEINNC